MKAAVVTAYGTGPRYADTPSPRATEEHEIVVDVLAAGLHPRVRMQADGSHYTSSPDELPLVPGLDGVGRGPDGRLWFFATFGGRSGSMAENKRSSTPGAASSSPTGPTRWRWRRR